MSILKRKTNKKLALPTLLNRVWHQLFYALLLSPLLSFTHRSPLNYCVWQKSLHLGPPPSMIPSSSSPWQKTPVFTLYCCDSAFRLPSFFPVFNLAEFLLQRRTQSSRLFFKFYSTGWLLRNS